MILKVQLLQQVLQNLEVQCILKKTLNILNGEKTLQQVEKEQEDFKKDLNEIVAGNPKYKSEKQSYTIKNVRNLYDSRQKIINLLNDIAKIRSGAIYKPKIKTKLRERDLKY